jgi:hypothetical protein
LSCNSLTRNATRFGLPITARSVSTTEQDDAGLG